MNGRPVVGYWTNIRITFERLSIILLKTNLSIWKLKDVSEISLIVGING